MMSEERLRLATVSTPSCGFPYSWKPESPFKITWSLDIFDAPYVDRLMQRVLSLCMWSVFGLCAVRHRIGRQWRSRRVPRWQNLLSLQIMVCVHVKCECVCRHGMKCDKESWIYCCRLFSGMIHWARGVWGGECDQFFPLVTVISRVGKFKYTLYFFDTIMTCFIMHGTGSAYW